MRQLIYPDDYKRELNEKEILMGNVRYRFYHDIIQQYIPENGWEKITSYDIEIQPNGEIYLISLNSNIFPDMKYVAGFIPVNNDLIGGIRLA